jgi:hypothetical protein
LQMLIVINMERKKGRKNLIRIERNNSKSSLISEEEINEKIYSISCRCHHRHSIYTG